jgi:tripartite-type tricarboxylate transporter receptor subunit TctC
MLVIRLFLVCVLSIFSTASVAEIKFNKPITIIVSFPPGGDTDVIARILADKLSLKINQSVLVQNKSGASGIIGNRLVAEAKPDGYTLLLSPSTIVTSQLVMKNSVTYDVRKDFTPIIEISKNTVLFIAVNSSLNAKNHKELLEKIKSGEVKAYATPGSGSPMNIVGEYYKNQIGMNLVQVPYRGNAPAVFGLLSGDVSMIITSLLPIRDHIENKKITVIGAASSQRSQFLPHVPTLHEQGLAKADFSGWMSIFGPANMDPKMINELNKHLNEILKDPEVIDKMLSLAHTPGGGTPEEMSKLVTDLYNRFESNIKKFNIKINAE